MLQKKYKKVSTNYECKYCNYITHIKCNYDKHLLTAKHQNSLNVTNVTKKYKKVSTFYDCIYCHNMYNSRMSLWRHQKQCDGEKEDKLNLILEQNQELMKENQELKKTQNEFMEKQQALTNTVINICSHMQPNITNLTNNSHNKTFNLNFFLNETCKNAMSLGEFVSSIQLQLEDLEDTGKIGYVNGISNIIINNLNKMETTDRPVHCTDSKRETIYIKNESMWLKDDKKEKITEAIKCISHKNSTNILAWRDRNPECNHYDSKINDKYLRIISNSMAGGSLDEINKNVNKIISNIAKEVIVDKV